MPRVRAAFTLLLGVLASGCQFGEAAPPPSLAVEGSNAEIKITVTHDEDDPEKPDGQYPDLARYRMYKEKYLYIEGYYEPLPAGGGEIIKIEGFLNASFKDGMKLPKMTRDTTADTVTIPLYLRTDYDDSSRRYSKFAFNMEGCVFKFNIWYFYIDTIWNTLVPPMGKRGTFSVNFSKVQNEDDEQQTEDFTRYNYSGAYSFNAKNIIPCEGWD